MAKAATVRKSEVRSQKSDVEKRSPLELNRLIHERLRLGILSALATRSSMTFGELKELLGTTDGNLVPGVPAHDLYVSGTVSFGPSARARLRAPAGARARRPCSNAPRAVTVAVLARGQL